MTWWLNKRRQGDLKKLHTFNFKSKQKETVSGIDVFRKCASKTALSKLENLDQGQEKFHLF